MSGLGGDDQTRGTTPDDAGSFDAVEEAFFSAGDELASGGIPPRQGVGLHDDTTETVRRPRVGRQRRRKTSMVAAVVGLPVLAFAIWGSLRGQGSPPAVSAAASPVVERTPRPAPLPPTPPAQADPVPVAPAPLAVAEEPERRSRKITKRSRAAAGNASKAKRPRVARKSGALVRR